MTCCRAFHHCACRASDWCCCLISTHAFKSFRCSNEGDSKPASVLSLLSLLCFHSPGTWASLVPFQVTNGTPILPTNVHQNYSINIIGEPPLLHTEAENWRPVGGGGGARSVGNGGNNQQAALKTIVFVLCPLSPLPSTLSSPNLSSHRDIGQEDLSWFGANLIRSALANPMPCQSVIVWEETFHSKCCDVFCTKTFRCLNI